MCGAKPLLPLNVPSWRGQRQLHVYQYSSRNLDAKIFPLYILHSWREVNISRNVCVCVYVCACVCGESWRGGGLKEKTFNLQFKMHEIAALNAIILNSVSQHCTSVCSYGNVVEWLSPRTRVVGLSCSPKFYHEDGSSSFQTTCCTPTTINGVRSDFIQRTLGLNLRDFSHTIHSHSEMVI
jgi:hypothetical protein